MAKLYKTPIQTIRDKCLDCCVWQPKEVRLFPALGCPNWLYRRGVRPLEEDIKQYEEHQAKKHEHAKENRNKS